MNEERPDGVETSPHYILAAEGSAPHHAFVLKQDSCFAICDEIGDIGYRGAFQRAQQGLYCTGTRFLSRLELALNGQRPLLLGSTVRRDNLLLAAELTNPDFHSDGQVALARGALHISRVKWLWQAACYERLRIRSFSPATMSVELAIRFDADYADVFEVRGERRPRRGTVLAPVHDDGSVTLAYRGLDGRERRTRLECKPAPTTISAREMCFRLELERGAEHTILLTIGCSIDDEAVVILAHPESFVRAAQSIGRREVLDCRAVTSNERLNAWLDTSAADLGMMLTATPEGLYPYAGVPWFNAPFGRDGIITALETLWLWPNLARGVLAFLAATQATEVDPARDAEPGKIVHEMRSGEMATLGEVPFGRYYGSVDATPLFVMLAHAYFQRTADLAFIDSIWPQLRAALDWIDRYGDTDHDGLVEYCRSSADGLVQQGWKDSHDSVFHADGTLAPPPIALCEVQAYVHAAKRGAATLAGALGDEPLQQRLRAEASKLRNDFESQFWRPAMGMYALALDGQKRPCEVLTSNPGHCLFAGIASADHARSAVERFCGKEYFSGWGVRTVAEGQPNYNPMSYHNGSIWPHDNAILAAGAARYGSKSLVARMLEAQLEASVYFNRQRLPELFCGFTRRPGEAPTGYPVACSPQSWAAGAGFLLLGACLGVEIDAAQRRIIFREPLLPRFVDEVTIQGLTVGSATVELKVHRYSSTVGVDVRHRTGPVEVVVQS